MMSSQRDYYHDDQTDRKIRRDISLTEKIICCNDMQVENE